MNKHLLTITLQYIGGKLGYSFELRKLTMEIRDIPNNAVLTVGFDSKGYIWTWYEPRELPVPIWNIKTGDLGIYREY